MAATKRTRRHTNPYAVVRLDVLEDRDSPVTLTVGPNIDVSQRPGNQAETAIAINPTNPSNIIAAANDDAIATGGGEFFAYSTNNAASFSQYQLGSPATPTVPTSEGDPTVAFDRFGNAFAGYLRPAGKNFQTTIVTSSDGGVTFTNDSPKTAGSQDQPKLATGVDFTNAARGAVWTSWNDGTGMEAAGEFTTGLGAVGAFTAPVVIPNSVGGNFGDLAVGPNGQVLIAYEIDNSPTGSGPAVLQTNLDPDRLGPLLFGSATANGRAVIATNVGSFRLIPGTSNNFGIDSEVRVAYDTSTGPHRGRVYEANVDAATDGTTGVPSQDNYTFIVLRFSDDDGQTWSNPVRVGAVNPGTTQFNDQLSVDPITGDVGVAWYDTRNSGASNNTTQLFAAVSIDNGATFTETQVSAGTSNSSLTGPPPNGLRDIGYGDYNRAAFYNGVFYPSWADNSNSTGNNPDGTTKFDLYTAAITVNASVPPVTPPVTPPVSPPGTPPVTPPIVVIPPTVLPLVVGAGVGQLPIVTEIDPLTGQVIRSFQAYDSKFTGGVNVVAADVTGDGVPDIITSPASHGGADIRVWDGVTGKLVANFLAYGASFDGGASLAIGNLNGVNDIITGAGDGGGPHVRVFSGITYQDIGDFLAFSPNFRGGIDVASADFDLDGKSDIVVSASADGGADVRIFHDGNATDYTDLIVADPRYRGGISIAAGYFLNDGGPDLVVGAASGSTNVTVFARGGHAPGQTFEVYPGFTGGIRLTAIDPTASGHAYLATAPGAGGGENIRVYNLPSEIATLDVVVGSGLGGATVG